MLRFLPILFLGFLFSACESPSVGSLDLTVIVPKDTDQVYVVGNTWQLDDWLRQGLRLNHVNDTTWQGIIAIPSDKDLEFKLTRGSWQTEALRPDGIEFTNFVVKTNQDTSMTLRITLWRDQFSDRVIISKDRFDRKNQLIEFFEKWAFSPFDSVQFQDPDYHDSHWVKTQSSLPKQFLTDHNWTGSGWFRTTVAVTPEWVNQPLIMSVFQSGASEIFLNGKLLKTVGNPHTEPDHFENKMMRTPYPVVFPDTLNSLAVRYTFPRLLLDASRMEGVGFVIVIYNTDTNYPSIYENDRNATIFQITFTVIPLVLAFVHLILFAYSRDQWAHFYYGICMLGFGGLSFSTLQSNFVESFDTRFVMNNLTFTFGIIAVNFGLLTNYANQIKQFPVQAKILTGIAIILILWNWIPSFSGPYLSIAFYIFLGISIVEMIRVSIIGQSSKNERYDWVMAVGFLTGLTIIVLQLVSDIFNLGLMQDYPIYVYGVVIIGMSVSIQLSRQFARTQQSLKTQLKEVQRLSSENLAKERHMREAEIERRVLEADNQRKTAELDAARDFQLSLLPQKIDRLGDYDIRFDMQTASEVGGDYYDYKKENGGMVLAIGDATGHGMKSGQMVIAIKSLFQSQPVGATIPDFLNRASLILADMKLKQLYMSLTVMNVSGPTVTVSTAGMPPVKVIRNNGEVIENIILKGLPLGLKFFDYDQKVVVLNPGDVVVAVSDGWTELFNSDNETLPEEKMDLTLKSSGNDPDRLIFNLKRLAQEWRGDTPLRDDMTLMVLKYRPL